jgi:hypothetical protein
VSKTASKAPAKRNEALPVSAADLEQYAGQGVESVGRDDVALPFINVLQALSPQVNKRNADYVEGAEAGGLINTVTGQVRDGAEGARVIPAYYEKVFTEWWPRKEGGGFVGIYGTAQEAYDNQTKGTEIQETAQHYVLIETPDGNWTEAMIPMTSTKLKVSRQWNANILTKKLKRADGTSFVAPSFAYVYRFTTVETENQHGTFFVPRVVDERDEDGRALMVEDADLFARARALHDVAASGEARQRVNAAAQAGDEDEEDDENAPAF